MLFRIICNHRLARAISNRDDSIRRDSVQDKILLNRFSSLLGKHLVCRIGRVRIRIRVGVSGDFNDGSIQNLCNADEVVKFLCCLGRISEFCRVDNKVYRRRFL